jgi:acetyl-CoA/propionyl-CoA/long-chain acyl-CoA carboxylase, biotin carboxylase, biotin carboxyl carrier protein
VSLFGKVLVANRGEIAVRIFRTLRELEIGTVAIYSEADRGSLHASFADEAYLVGPGPAAESYLHQERILAAAKRAGAEAIHPGYGFLAENASFARAVQAAGLVWIGPPAEAIELMGSKVAARELMAGAGVPIIPGTTKPVETVDEVLRLGKEYGWPIAIKAVAGGGGKGLKTVGGPDEAERALAAARREGESYFSDGTVYVEKFIEDPRHVEVQVLADEHGNVVHLGERDCTIQRRHQKIVEETPSPAVSGDFRERIGRIAVDAARAVGYRSAGTIEGLLDGAGDYWFLEMNTRIQVEHPVTELVTGVDLVREQVLIAAGEPTTVRQAELRFSGHAIECRLNAEDAANGFLPSPGVITAYREPAGPGIRVDSGVTEGSEVVDLYDPLIAKLCVWDVDRERARLRMLRALDELVLEGVTTLSGLHKALLRHPCFIEATTCHGLVESEELAQEAKQLSHQTTNVARTPDGRLRERLVELELDGRRYGVKLLQPEPPHAELARRRRERAGGGSYHAAAKEAVVSPMQGTVLAVEVAEGEEVRAGQVICVVEAMKMENEITAHRYGMIGELSVAAGEPVSTGQVICVVTQEGDETEPL